MRPEGSRNTRVLDGTKFTQAFIGIVAAQVVQSLPRHGRERASVSLVFRAPLPQRGSVTPIRGVPVKSHVGWEARNSMKRRSVTLTRAPREGRAGRSRGRPRGTWGTRTESRSRVGPLGTLVVKDANCVREGDAGKGTEIPIRVSVFAWKRRESGRGWPPGL